MVDALSEIRRCLVPAGTLVDVRPVARKNPLEVVTTDGAVTVGNYPDTGMIAEDAAADAAVASALSNRWFVAGDDAQFDFNYYWDTVAELDAYLKDSNRARGVVVSLDGIEERLAAARETSGDSARLRCQRRFLMNTYIRNT